MEKLDVAPTKKATRAGYGKVYRETVDETHRMFDTTSTELNNDTFVNQLARCYCEIDYAICQIVTQLPLVPQAGKVFGPQSPIV